MKKLLSMLLVLTMLLSACSLGFAEAAQEPVTLTVLHSTQTSGTDYGDYGCWGIVRDKLNIEVEFVHVDPSVMAEQFSIMLNADTLPEVLMYVGDFAKNAEVYQLGQQKYLLPLNDLIDEYAPTIKSYLENDPFYAKVATAPDGNIYAVPAHLYGVGQEYRHHTWINTDFLAALNMEMPTTIDELYAYLKGVKENDVNGNGDPNDEIPIMSFGTGWNGNVVWSSIMAAFTPFSVETPLYVTDEGQVVYIPATDGFREGLKFIAKLYDEGLIYKEAFSSDRTVAQSVGMSGGDKEIVGMVFGHNFLSRTSDGFDPCIDHWEVLSAFEGGTLPYDPYAVYQVKNSITSNCKHPEAAMRLLEYIATEEGTNLAKRGIEGMNYTAPHEGATTTDGVTPAQYRYYSDAEKEELGIKSPAEKGFYWGWCSYETALTEANEATPNADGRMHFNDKYCNGYFARNYANVNPNPENYWNTMAFFSEDALADVALYETDLKNQMTMAVTEFAMGVRDVNDDAAWNKYLEELDSMGLSAYLKICQETYDASK